MRIVSSHLSFTCFTSVLFSFFLQTLSFFTFQGFVKEVPNNNNNLDTEITVTTKDVKDEVIVT